MIAARGRRLGPRRPVDPRPGDRPRRGRGHRRAGARHARPCRPRAHPPAAAAGAGGDAGAALAELDQAHELGIDPTQLLRGLMESLHAATRAKAGATADAMQSAEERESAAEMAQKLGWGTIHRLWQMLLKGLQDVEIAPDPREAAEMALLRLIHAADMPDPAALDGEADRRGGRRRDRRPRRPLGRRHRPRSVPSDFRGLVAAARGKAGSISSRFSFTTRSASSATRRRSWC